MESLNQLLENSNWPILSAIILGIMTAISPCPLATNISAMGFLSRNITDKKKLLLQSLVYTLGRSLVYVGLATIFFIGISQASIQLFISKYAERFIGPLLIVIGIFMLDIIKFKFRGLLGLSEKAEKQSKSGSFWSVLLLGVVFALAFCPYSGVLYFFMLIPLTLSSPEGLILPLVFSIATALPVIFFAFIIAFAVSATGAFYNKIKVFEFWFRRVVSVIFIIAGLYLMYQIYIA